MIIENLDYFTGLPIVKKEALRPKAHDWIKNYLKKDTQWHRCYRLKQPMTREIGYCYQADMYDFLQELGFEVMVDHKGYHWAKATYRKSFYKRRRHH